MASKQIFERAYLASSIPAQIAGASSEIIKETYIPEAAELAALMLKSHDTMFEITKKIVTLDNNQPQTVEHSIPLTPEEYEQFVRLPSKELEKLRYYCAIYGKPAYVDIYQKELDGLVLLVFPFEGPAAMQSFVAPGVCLAEVTADALGVGGYLAGKSYEDLMYGTYGLERFSYEPLYMEKEED